MGGGRVSMGGAEAQECKSRRHCPATTLPPSDALPGRGRQRFGKIRDGHRTSALAPSQELRGAPEAAIGARSQRLRARWPYRRLTRDSHHIRNAPGGERITESRHHSVSRIRDHRGERQSFLAQMGDALEGDLPLRLERHLLRNSRLPPATAIVDPGLRNVETISGGNAHSLLGQRHRDGDLAVVLLTEHAAVLARHSDRVPPFLRNSCVVPYPGRHCAMTLHLLQYVVTRYPQDRLVIPRSIGNEVMQRLMAGPNVPRVDTGGHRLRALSLPRPTGAPPIRTQRLAAGPVPQHRGPPPPGGPASALRAPRSLPP